MTPSEVQTALVLLGEGARLVHDDAVRVVSYVDLDNDDLIVYPAEEDSDRMPYRIAVETSRAVKLPSGGLDFHPRGLSQVQVHPLGNIDPSVLEFITGRPSE